MEPGFSYWISTALGDLELTAWGSGLLKLTNCPFLLGIFPQYFLSYSWVLSVISVCRSWERIWHMPLLLFQSSANCPGSAYAVWLTTPSSLDLVLSQFSLSPFSRHTSSTTAGPVKDYFSADPFSPQAALPMDNWSSQPQTVIPLSHLGIPIRSPGCSPCPSAEYVCSQCFHHESILNS